MEGVIIYAINVNDNPRKCPSLTYVWNLVNALCNPQTERTFEACIFKRNTVNKMDLVLAHSKRQLKKSVTEVKHENRLKKVKLKKKDHIKEECVMLARFR